MRRAAFILLCAFSAIILGAVCARAYERLGTGGDDVLRGGPVGGGLNGMRGDDRVLGNDGKDIAYGGRGSDFVRGGRNAAHSTDDLFGGGFCSETGYYGFQRTAEQKGWPDPSTIPCGVDGPDILNGGPGRDWLWESNSDNHGDGQIDVLDGGPGFDVCVAEAEDIVVDCEDVRIVS
jgi:Ca2+-binding RTX toxin-like protein